MTKHLKEALALLPDGVSAEVVPGRHKHIKVRLCWNGQTTTVTIRRRPGRPDQALKMKGGDLRRALRGLGWEG